MILSYKRRTKVLIRLRRLFFANPEERFSRIKARVKAGKEHQKYITYPYISFGSNYFPSIKVYHFWSSIRQGGISGKKKESHCRIEIFSILVLLNPAMTS